MIRYMALFPMKRYLAYVVKYLCEIVEHSENFQPNHVMSVLHNPVMLRGNLVPD